LSFDFKTGNGKAFSKYLEAAKDAFKPAPRRPIEEVLGTPLVQVGPLRVAVVTVTPEMAWELLLKHNVHNRPISYSHAAKLALEILGKRWKLSHQGGGFNKAGDLEDVQHRCVGVILANEPAQIMMVTDLTDDLFKVIDLGKTRSAGSALELAGHNGDSTLLSQIITGLAIPYDEKEVHFFRPKGKAKRPIGRSELIEYADDNPWLIEAAHECLDVHETAMTAIGDKPAAVFAYAKIRETFGQDVADDFYEQVADDSHADKHTITALQRRIDKHKLGKRAGKDDPSKKNVLNREQIVWLIAAAFRAMQSNKRSVRLDPRGDDEFPRFEDSVAPPPAEAAA
jgi:hypothetical protein